MFENVLGQEAAAQLSQDILKDTLAPSMLFRGPAASGKGTAALELARVLSCQDVGKNGGGRALWNCACPACSRHRLLYHPDLLVLGSRSFSREIAAAARIFAAESGETSSRLLFIRAVRKLLIRFSPVLWEDDPKAGKLSPLIESLEADLDEIIARFGTEAGAKKVPDGDWAAKIGEGILKSAFKLEAEGVGELIPVAHIRRAAYWSRMAPQGRRKFLLIENADRMQDAARNALLKILEEPPDRVAIVLTTAHGDALLPTIRSRLRPYRFYPRSAEVEKEVIRRVFHNAPSPEGESSAEVGASGKAVSAEAEVPAAANAPAETAAGAGSLLPAYLDSFLPVSPERLYPLAAYLAASVTYQAVVTLKARRVSPLPEELVALGKHAAPIAEAAGLGRPAKDTGSCVQGILAGAEKFEVPGLFAQFLRQLLRVVSGGLRGTPVLPGGNAALADIWRRAVGEAADAVGVYNQGLPLVLDRLCTELKGRITGLYAG
jgi:DNA polymerase-3 subunit gamma/tau